MLFTWVLEWRILWPHAILLMIYSLIKSQCPDGNEIRIWNSITASWTMSRQADWLAELLLLDNVWLMQAQLKSASADLGCPNIISQIWEQGLPSMHLLWLHDFWPAHWRRRTVFCLTQNILWKSSKCLMDRLRTPLAEKPEFPQFLLSLLSSRNLIQNIICGQEAVKPLGNTQP